MKINRNLWVYAILLLIGVQAHSQQNQFLNASDSDPDAKAVLDKVIENLEQYNNYLMTFEMDLGQPGTDNIIQSGKVVVSDKKFRFEMGNQLIIHDGKYNWIYLKQRNELQILDGEEENSVMSPNYFLSVHKSGDFVYSLMDEKLNGLGEKIVRIDFKPTDSFSEYKKIGIDINTGKRVPEKMIILLSDGTRVILNNIRIKELSFDEVKGSFFFDTSKYKGLQIEDLRLD